MVLEERGGAVTADTPLVSQQAPERQDTRVAETWHTVVLILIITVWAALGYFGANRARAQQNPNRLVSYAATAAWEWAVVAYISWGVRRRGMRFRELLGNRWKSGLDFLRDWGIAIGFWIIALFVLGTVGHGLGAKQDSQNVGFLLPVTGLEMFCWVLLSGTAGFCEEIMFRGYFQRQFIAWTGNASAGVILSALCFGAAHIYGGVKSAIIITVYGALFGILAQLRGSLIPGIMTHAWHDSVTGLFLKPLLDLAHKYGYYR
jgi:uncharacterized protein